MKVILLVDIKGKGKKGETVEVADSYGRNVLIAKKQAVEATTSNINNLKLQKAHEEKVSAEEYREAVQLANLLTNNDVHVTLKTGKDGKPFGSISNKDIADAIDNKWHIKIDKKRILLKEAIKSLGDTTVKIKLHPKVLVSLNVIVDKELK